MGQYYRIAFKRKGDRKAKVNDRKVDGVDDYIMAKLREHGYLGTYICKAVANILANGRTRLAWVGDYADDGDLRQITSEDLNKDMVWGKNPKHTFTDTDFNYVGKFLVNHTKKVYISFNEYIAHAKDDEYILSPFTILTAVGNGQGGGDYFGKNAEMAGDWAWDELSIEKSAPDGYEPMDVFFGEDED